MHLLPLIYTFVVFYDVIAAQVMEYTDSTFEAAKASLRKDEVMLTMFYAPWCGHCKKLKPEFEKAATIVSENVRLAKVDCTEGGKDTCNKNDVTGYPTLKIFTADGVVKDYGGPREANGIRNYMEAQVGPSSKDLTTVEDFESFINKDRVVIVGFFESESDLKGEFLKVSNKLREKFLFGHTSNGKIMEKESAKDAIKIYRPKMLSNKFEPDVVTYDGKADQRAIETWINKNYLGIAGHRTRENSGDFESPLVVAYYNVDYVKNPKGTNYWRNRVLKVATLFPGKFTFAVSSKDDFQHELNEFGIDYVAGDKPVICARNAKGLKYAMKDEFNLENFELFLTDLSEGSLTPFMKSEPVPDEQKALKVAVAKNFDEIVMNNGKDTLIEFYAPWCGHCKQLAPIYEELAELLKDEDVAIVKMDATANDIPPPFSARGFPTIYWAPKDSKQNPEKYGGGRELKDFIEFIASHATNPLKGYDEKGIKKEAKEEL